MSMNLSFFFFLFSEKLSAVFESKKKKKIQLHVCDGFFLIWCLCIFVGESSSFWFCLSLNLLCTLFLISSF
ncbi:hypothetical protein I3760_09G131200 [Carya illinoinensis]|nr:hypothetical protein I3760_09G131200 [Carya illinoinensis]